ncbi:MAG: C69 family dipeptidase [Bacteroidales bacterium]|nr:C69 family dipeptidase [Bacteroidales bacterium]
MRKTAILLTTLFIAGATAFEAGACTNVLVTPGASADGSAMISYAADSHLLYGELYFHPAGRFKAGSMLGINEWDTYRYRGEIEQVARTYKTVGNMNEKQLVIGETTWGGRLELMDPEGIMDYGSLIYVTLQRAVTAREAISTIVELADRYGYPSEGETFSIADKEEVWVMDLIGKGPGTKGIAWVAMKVPDGYICAHANQARIRTSPQNGPENCLFDPEMIEFARQKGYFTGEDAEFSFREAFCPLDFGTVRGCDARVWSAFNILCDGTFTYTENGQELSSPASEWLNYAMGYDLGGELPLFVKPSRKISVKNVADVMRDHYEGTPMDMRVDIGAGGNACPYRWRPLEFEWEGKTYLNERAIATQQTGFWFVSQSRASLPDIVGALLWFGTDDAATSYLTPIYVATKKVPECFRTGNGNILEYSPASSFWINNRVANQCYKMYNLMEPVVRAEIDSFENRQIEAVREMDAKVSAYRSGRRISRALTEFTLKTADDQFAKWVELERMLLVKFIDGNVKAQNADGSFIHTADYEGLPDSLKYGGYTDVWKAAVVAGHGDVIEIK